MKVDFTYKEITKTHKKIVPRDSGEGKMTIWTKKTPSPVFLCSCGIKYLKTRRAQDKCLACFVGMPVYNKIK